MKNEVVEFIKVLENRESEHFKLSAQYHKDCNVIGALPYDFAIQELSFSINKLKEIIKNKI